MIFAWGWRSWLLLVLAAVVVASYFGVLGSVEERLAKSGPPPVIQRLANQPQVADAFKDPSGGRMDAYVVMFLFVFLSPLALCMVVMIGIFLVSALATALGPLLGGEKYAMLVVEILAGAVVYAKQDLWLPHVVYFLGLIARAYVVITT